jgi:hypothetical protein
MVVVVGVLVWAFVLRAPGGGVGPMTTTPDGRVAVPAAAPPWTTPEASQAFDKVRGRFPVDDRQAACVAAEIQNRAGLLRALDQGEAAGGSLDEVAVVVGRCVGRTTMADQWAVNVATRAGGLGPDALACLRDGYARLDARDLDALQRAASSPGTSVPGLQSTVTAILDRCGVARDALHPT